MNIFIIKILVILFLGILLFIGYVFKTTEKFTNNNEKDVKKINIQNEIKNLKIYNKDFLDILKSSNDTNLLNEKIAKSKASYNIILDNLQIDNNVKLNDINYTTFFNTYYTSIIADMNNDKTKLTDKNYNDIIINFNNGMDKLEIAALNKLSNNAEIFADIDNKFKELNGIYKDIYINKVNKYDEKKEDIDALIINIFNLLLKIATNEDLSNSGIILILNTLLKRAYENNNINDINSTINSFNEKVNAFNPDKKNIITPEVSQVSQVIPTTTTPKQEYIINSSVNSSVNSNINVNNEFNNANNAFELLNIIYKNNLNLSDAQIKNINELNNTIYLSIINISKNNLKYNDKITSIANAIVKPILETQLKEGYSITNQDAKNIAVENAKKNFVNAMLSIKDTLYITNSYKINEDVCLKEITEAIFTGNYPINTKEIKSCSDSTVFNNKNIMLYPKMSVSKDNGKSWTLATDLYEYKKSGVNNNPFLYSYQIAASSNEGKDWNFIFQGN